MQGLKAIIWRYDGVSSYQERDLNAYLKDWDPNKRIVHITVQTVEGQPMAHVEYTFFYEEDPHTYRE